MSSIILSLLLACGGDAPNEIELPVEPPEPQVISAPDHSRTLSASGEISVVTVKNGTVEVPGVLTDISGTIRLANAMTWEGMDGSLSIGVGSWNSGDQIRDQRVGEVFFRVAEFSRARFHLKGISGVPSSGVTSGMAVPATISGLLEMHGASVPVEAAVTIMKSDGDFRVDSIEPVVLSINALGMQDDLTKLITVCGHESVDDRVKITFSMELDTVADAKSPKEEAPAGPSGKAKAGR